MHHAPPPPPPAVPTLLAEKPGGGYNWGGVQQGDPKISSGKETTIFFGGFAAMEKISRVGEVQKGGYKRGAHGNNKRVDVSHFHKKKPLFEM